jgi:hypothetical protein
MKPKAFVKIFAALSLTTLFAAPAMAQSESGDDEWSHSLGVYLWGADIGGATSSGSDIDVGFSDLLDNLNFGAMGVYQGRKGKWSVISNLVYLDVSANEPLDLIPPIGGDLINVTTDVELDLTGWVIELGGGYNLYNNGQGTVTDFILGARYLDLSTDVLLNFNLGAPDQDIKVPLSASGHVWDAIVGLSGKVQFADRWFMPWGANIGAGDSDLTWSVRAGVGFNAASWVDIVATYRYLKWELDGELVDDISFSGPMLGAVFRF